MKSFYVAILTTLLLFTSLAYGHETLGNIYLEQAHDKYSQADYPASKTLYRAALDEIELLKANPDFS